MAYSSSISDALRDLLAASGIQATFEERGDHGIFTIRM